MRHDGDFELPVSLLQQESGPATAPTAARAADAPVGTPAPDRSRPGPRGTQQPELVASGGPPVGRAGGGSRRARPLLLRAHLQLRVKVTVMPLSPGQPPSQDSDMQEKGSSLHHQ